MPVHPWRELASSMGVAKLVKSFEFHQLSLKGPVFRWPRISTDFHGCKIKSVFNLCSSVARTGEFDGRSETRQEF